ncbi:hypothetical protein ON010_g15118 [Phytophthora cinnamomi]|nr:hypothetical protein ON010_g15118 [Phytophthora cinnamomi]
MAGNASGIVLGTAGIHLNAAQPLSALVSLCNCLLSEQAQEAPNTPSSLRHTTPAMAGSDNVDVVEQAVRGDLRHLAHEVDVGEVGHDFVDLGVPFVGSSKATVEDGDAQRRVAHGGEPRVEHVLGLVLLPISDVRGPR